MDEHRYSPEPARLSVLTATVLLAFALTRIISTPHYDVFLPLGGLNLSFTLNLNTVIVLLAAGLTAAGVIWLLQTHPSLEKGEVAEHWLLPTLTVVVIGVALYSLPSARPWAWWAGFALGAAILVAVVLAEYIAVDSTDVRFPLASTILTVLAFVIFLILTAALKAANARLILAAPAIFLGSSLAALRTLHLHLGERWERAWAIGIGVVATQLGAAAHYLPLTPVRYSLLLLGPVYALTILSVNLIEKTPLHRALAEPFVMLILFWGLAVWFR